MCVNVMSERTVDDICLGKHTVYNVLFHVFHSFVVYLYVNGSGSITSVVEERANLSAVVYL